MDIIKLIALFVPPSSAVSFAPNATLEPRPVALTPDH